MDKNGNVETKRMLDILRSKGILIVFILMSFIFLGYMYSHYYVVPEYKSTATLLLIPNSASENKTLTTSDLNLNSGLISTYSSIAKQSRVLKQVIENLNLNMTENELLSKLKVSTVDETYVIKLAVSDTNPEKAMKITREFSDVFLKEIKEIYNLENIGIVDEAEIPSEPYNINHIKNIIKFIAIGMAISCALVAAIYILDNTVKTEEDIEAYVKIKTLGKIPLNENRKEEIAVKDDAKSYVTECINSIRTNILYMTSIKSAKTVLITSCKAQDGKSWVSANIATSFAETNKKVLIIDADMRKGRANKIFNIENKEGLSNYLYFMTGNVKEDLDLGKKYIKETKIPNLHILTNGNIPPNPSELLDSSNMKELIKILKKVYDVIIIDAPPCLPVADSIILSTIADSTVLVASSNKTKIEELVEVSKSIKIVGGKLIGVILNKVKITGRTYSKSYYYGHSKKEDKCKVKQREMITVDEVFDQAMLKIDDESYEVSFEENDTNIIDTENKINNIQKQVNTEERENKSLEKIINTISEIKQKININSINYNRIKEENGKEVEEIIGKKLSEFEKKNNSDIKQEIQNLNFESKLNEITEEIKNMNYADELSRISNELEKVKSNSENRIDKEELIHNIERIYSQIAEIKSNNEQLIKDTNYIDSFIETINKGKITREEIKDIIKAEVLTSEQVEEIVNKGKLTREEIEDIVKTEVLTSEQVEEIVNKGKLTREEIEDIVKAEVLTSEQVEEIVNKGKLTREEIEDIVRAEVLTSEQVEEIVNKGKLTREEIKDIIKAEVLTSEQVEEIVNREKLTREEVQSIIKAEMLTREEIEKIIKKEILKIDYTKQFEQIGEMILSLKDNYLELSNRLNTEQYSEIEKQKETNPGNIIDIKELKKKKRKSYSIKEEISYSDLEETAFCIMPFETHNSSQENYEKAL